MQTLPFAFEKLFDQAGAFLLKHSAADFCPRVQKRGREQAVAPFWVRSAIYDPSYLGPVQSRGAHWARLHRNI